MKKLFDCDIKSLPDASKLSDYSISQMDAGMIDIEYSDKFIYRFYSYFAPNSTPNYPEVRQLENIIKIISKELKFPQVLQLL